MGLVHLIKAEPTLLPEVDTPEYAWPMGSYLRVLAPHVVCLYCGQTSQCAYVAHTDTGPRWLDLCHLHGLALRQGLETDAAKHGDVPWGQPPWAMGTPT